VGPSPSAPHPRIRVLFTGTGNFFVIACVTWLAVGGKLSQLSKLSKLPLVDSHDKIFCRLSVSGQAPIRVTG
jgi:hypothetical protein